MSIESARDFLERMKTDEDFKKRVSKARDAEREKIIAEAGFDFTDEELEQVSGELDSEDLEQVAGGTEGMNCTGFCNQACDSQGCETEKVCDNQCGNECKNKCRSQCSNESKCSLDF